jgi:hypothetical protein
MSSQAGLEQLVRDEFMAYYLADEMPAGEESAAFLDQLAGESAGRLYARLDGQHIAGLVALLRAAADDPLHPLLVEITDRSDVAWIDDEGDNTLAEQLRRIADKLVSLQLQLQGRQT